MQDGIGSRSADGCCCCYVYYAGPLPFIKDMQPLSSWVCLYPFHIGCCVYAHWAMNR